MGCFSGWVSKQISLVPLPNLVFQAVILPPVQWDTACIYYPKRQLPSRAVSSQWGKRLVLLAVCNSVFWAGLSQRRGKSRKQCIFWLGAGGLAGKHLDMSVVMAIDDRGWQVSNSTKMQCLLWVSTVPWLMGVVRRQPSSLLPPFFPHLSVMKVQKFRLLRHVLCAQEHHGFV